MPEKFKPTPKEVESSGNLRGQELAQKAALGTASEEEKAELAALRQFPDNLRGQELAQKAALGTASEEEKAELAKLRTGQK